MLPDWCLSRSGHVEKDQAHHSADRPQCESAREAVEERLTNISRLDGTTIPWILHRIDDSIGVIDLAKSSRLAARRLGSPVMEPRQSRNLEACNIFCRDGIDGYTCFHPALQSVNQVISMTQLHERNKGVRIAPAATASGCDEHYVLDQQLLYPHHHGGEKNSINTVPSTQSSEEWSQAQTQAQISNLGGSWTMVDSGEEGRIWERKEEYLDQHPQK